MNLKLLALHNLWVPLLALCLYLLRRKLERFSEHSLVHRLPSLPLTNSRWALAPELCLGLAFAALCFALLDPVLSLSRIRVATRGLNIVMAVDLSSSMLEFMNQDDYQVSTPTSLTKLEVVKDAVDSFLDNREGDRVATVVFSEQAYVAHPLTVDYQYVADYVDYVDFRTLAGEGRTAIGEALFSGFELIRRMDPQRQHPAVLIVFTDGENNAGRSIYEALERAVAERIRVYLVGLDVWFLRERPRLETSLAATGGGFFDVQNTIELEQAYQHIDRLERHQLITERYVRDAPFYFPFVGLAFGLLVVGSLLRNAAYFSEIY